MSNDKLILGVVRELFEGLTNDLDEIRNDIADLKKNSVPGAAQSDMPDEKFDAIMESHQVLASICGQIYSKVSPDQALPEHLLNNEVMLDFMVNYPKDGPSPLTDNRQKQLADNQKKVPDADSDYLKQGYSSMREQSDPTSTDLYYFREMEALLAKELDSRGESLFTDHEPMDPKLLQQLKVQEIERSNERHREVDRGIER